MRDVLNRNRRLYLRSLWMINLRWIAILLVAIITIITVYYFRIELYERGIYFVCLLLILENMVSVFFLRRIGKVKEIANLVNNPPKKIKLDYIRIKRTINFQILSDLFLLTLLLYFTGGVENPFVFFYFFHLAIASVLLSQKETYMHTLVAFFLFVILVYSAYFEVLPYYALHINQEFVDIHLYKDSYFVLKNTVTFVATVFILVYLASSIGRKLQTQEEKYIEALEKLEEKDKIKNEYVLRVTHDVKGHLAAIQSNLSVLNSRILGPLDEKHEGFIERAYKRTFMATHFVRDLLKITRLRMMESVEGQPFDMRRILLQAIKDTRANAEEKNIELTEEIEEDLGIVVGDEFSILEITSNLILNAVKYTNENGRIKLKAIKMRDDVLVTIQDNGLGIPEDEKDKIFEEFYRGSNVKKIIEDGTGIGLAIVKKVIEQHDGVINVESTLGKGSKFYYILPKFS